MDLLEIVLGVALVDGGGHGVVVAVTTVRLTDVLRHLLHPTPINH